MEPDLPNLLATAEDAARAAGDILAKGTGLRHINHQSAKDVKLRADTESEALVRRLLAPTGLPIIGEEEGGDAALMRGDRPYWVVDPLDGTFNYLRNFGPCCVSIGLMQGLRPLCGVIYDFNHDECFRAAPAAEDPALRALCVNAEPVTADWPTSQADAVLCFGFANAGDYSDAGIKGFVRHVQAFAKVRMIGSAAMAMAMIATGRCDAYFEEKLRLWDVAAGLSLAESAGASWHLSIVEGADAALAQVNIFVAGRPEWLPEGILPNGA